MIGSTQRRLFLRPFKCIARNSCGDPGHQVPPLATTVPLLQISRKRLLYASSLLTTVPTHLMYPFLPRFLTLWLNCDQLMNLCRIGFRGNVTQQESSIPSSKGDGVIFTIVLCGSLLIFRSSTSRGLSPFLTIMIMFPRYLG